MTSPNDLAIPGLNSISPIYSPVRGQLFPEARRIPSLASKIKERPRGTSERKLLLEGEWWGPKKNYSQNGPKPFGNRRTTGKPDQDTRALELAS